MTVGAEPATLDVALPEPGDAWSLTVEVARRATPSDPAVAGDESAGTWTATVDRVAGGAALTVTVDDTDANVGRFTLSMAPAVAGRVRAGDRLRFREADAAATYLVVTFTDA